MFYLSDEEMKDLHVWIGTRVKCRLARGCWTLELNCEVRRSITFDADIYTLVSCNILTLLTGYSM